MDRITPAPGNSMAEPGRLRHDRTIASSPPTPAVYLLIGYPAAGKYTIACELARQLEAQGRPTRVVDNHYVNNPIFELLDVDGRTKLPAAVWDHVHRLREVLLDTVEHLSPPHLSFVFTNFIGTHESDVADPYLERLRRIAGQRGAGFRPVVLRTDPADLERRAANPDRAARLKWVDGAALRALADEVTLYESEGAIEIDTSRRTPEEAARDILSTPSL